MVVEIVVIVLRKAVCQSMLQSSVSLMARKGIHTVKGRECEALFLSTQASGYKA